MSVVTATILSEGQPMDPLYELLSLDITKEVNRIPHAQLMLLDGDLAHATLPISDTAFFEPGKTIEIKLRYEGEAEQEATVFKGLVLKHRVERDAHGTVLTIELKDAASKLTRTRHSKVYRQQTDADILRSLIRAHGLTLGMVADTQPQHAELVQYYCTDWDFLVMRAELQGLLVVVDNGHIALPRLAVSGPPQYRFTYGRDDIYDLEIEVDASQQPPGVESLAWDSKTQQQTPASKARAFDLSQGNRSGDTVARAIGAETYTLQAPVALAPQELQAWADGHLARSRMAMLRGRLSIPGLAAIKPLDVIELAGVGTRFNGTTLVTGMRHRVNTQGWLTDIQFGLAPERFATRDGIVDVPAAGLLPAVHGLQPGIVDAFTEDPDKQLRVRVILAGLAREAVWARLASPDAGQGRGYVFRPEPGDEVVVGFFHDDPRQAVILGALYSSKNTLPTAVGSITQDNSIKAIVTRKGTVIKFLEHDKPAVHIETPAKNTIVLDDEAQTMRLADQHGNTILLGQDGITIESARNVTIKARGNVDIMGQRVDVK
jgi:Rhs element Vgr protein